jgi:nitroreductase
MVRENMKKTAETSAPLLTEIAERWSPRAYDTTYEVSKEDLTSILEAGRWAPSASNLQPWRFSVVTRGEQLHTAIVEQSMSGFNAAWVPNASSVIFISVPAITQDGNAYPIAWFDAGLAAQNMMIQAQALGLATHPISGYNHEVVTELLGLEKDRNSIAAIVLGKSTDPSTLSAPAQEREVAPRTRLSLDEIVLHGLN